MLSNLSYLILCQHMLIIIHQKLRHLLYAARSLPDRWGRISCCELSMVSPVKHCLLTCLSLLWTHICALTGHSSQWKSSSKGPSAIFCANINPSFSHTLTKSRYVHLLFDGKQRTCLSNCFHDHSLLDLCVGRQFVWPDYFFLPFSRFQPQEVVFFKESCNQKPKYSKSLFI